MLFTAFSFSRVAASLAASLRRQPEGRPVERTPAQASAVAPVPQVELDPGEETPLSVQQIAGISARLPTLVNGPSAAGWWGIIFLILIELVVFSSLIVSYFYLRSLAPVWPSGAIEPPDLLLPTLNSLLLLGIAVPIFWSTRAIRRGNQTKLLIGLVLAAILGIIFLALKYVEYSDQDYTWATNAYGSVVWTMTGFHAVHVIAVVLKTLAIIYVALKGYFNARRHVAIEGNANYWYFVIGIWIPLYLTIYISPRLL
jgi:cytochrome c oxidase subunit III